MRWILRLLACCSLLIAAALLAGCVRSFWRNDSLFIERGARGYFVASARGRIGVIEVGGTWHPRRYHWASYDLATDSAVLTTIAGSADTKDLGILLSGDGKLGKFGQARWFAIPYLTPFVPFAAGPTLMLWRGWRRRRRTRRGLCHNCGYDLRGSPQRCPECGSVAQQAQPATATTTRDTSGVAA